MRHDEGRMNAQNVSVEIPTEKLGPPGIRGQLHMLAELPNEQREGKRPARRDTNASLKWLPARNLRYGSAPPFHDELHP